MWAQVKVVVQVFSRILELLLRALIEKQMKARSCKVRIMRRRYVSLNPI